MKVSPFSIISFFAIFPNPSIQDSKDPSLYWIGENGKEADNAKGTDFHAISNNYVSVTPLKIDQTKYSEVNQLSNWLENINY